MKQCELAVLEHNTTIKPTNITMFQFCIWPSIFLCLLLLPLDGRSILFLSPTSPSKATGWRPL
jgi:hypothetical protein